MLLKDPLAWEGTENVKAEEGGRTVEGTDPEADEDEDAAEGMMDKWS